MKEENNREKLSSVGLPASGASDGTSDALVNWVQTLCTHTHSYRNTDLHRL